MQEKKEIWILEDDQDCLFVYRESLGEKYNLTCFQRVDEFKKILNTSIEDKNLPSLVIADLVLTDGNFLDFLGETAYKNKLTMPLIIVSQMDDVDSLRLCFQKGAIDYLTKPFKKNELSVKIDHLFAKIENRDKQLLEGGNRSVDVDGKLVKDLTSKQTLLLTLFVNSPHRSITRQDILDKVWGDSTVHAKTVDVHLYNLRRKLHDYGYMIKSEGGGSWILLKDTID